MTKKEIITLARRLPSGFIELTREEYQRQHDKEVHETHISHVKNGRRDDQKVLDILLDLADEEDARKERNKKRAKGEPA